MKPAEPRRGTDWADLGTAVAGLDPGRFQTPKYATVAAELLRDLILDGTFAPGDRLNEVVLSERLQISRSPIREALRALSGQGLVTMVANRGAYVQTYTVKMLRELAVVRESLECTAVALAAERMTEAQLRAGRDMLDRVARELAKSPDSHAEPHKADFHAMIAEGAHNEQLAATIKAVESKFMIARARSGMNPDRARIAQAEHRAIVDAVEDRDAAISAEMMRSHLANSLESMLSSLDLSEG
jgi:DNA-binding GntR family transcriptional regulator